VSDTVRVSDLANRLAHHSPRHHHSSPQFFPPSVIVQLIRKKIQAASKEAVAQSQIIKVKMRITVSVFVAVGIIASDAFLLPSPRSHRQPCVIDMATSIEDATESSSRLPQIEPVYWKISPSLFYPEPRPLTPALRKAVQENTHPEETQSELGRGLSILSDWRENWYTYESPFDDPDLIDAETGYAEYKCEVEGTVPHDLVGTLYRNGPGKFGVGGERVVHVLDADALVYKIDIPPVDDSSRERNITFLSRFVLTEYFEEERKADRFLYRGTFGTGPYAASLDPRPKNGLNSDPVEPSALAKLIGGAFNTNIKSTLFFNLPWDLFMVSYYFSFHFGRFREYAGNIFWRKGACAL
jgi:hypothetical protein